MKRASSIGWSILLSLYLIVGIGSGRASSQTTDASEAQLLSLIAGDWFSNPDCTGPALTVAPDPEHNRLELRFGPLKQPVINLQSGGNEIHGVFPSENGGETRGALIHVVNALVVISKTDFRGVMYRCPGSIQRYRFSLNECRLGALGKKNSFARVKMSIPVAVYLADERLARAFVDDAVRFTRQQCYSQNKGFNTIMVYLTQAGKLIVEAAHDSGARGTVIKHNYYLEEERKFAKIAAQEAERWASKERLMTFLQKNNVETWPETRELVANPYTFEGKVIGLTAIFRQMLSRDTALFECKSAGYGTTPILVETLSPDTFTQPVYILLAAKINGVGTVNRGPFKLSVPSVDYIGHVVCNAAWCNDMTP